MMKSGINIELKNRLQSAIISLDRGSNEESLIEICSLAYLPTWAAPKFPQNAEWKHIEHLVKLEVYEASLEKQSDVAKAIQISGCAATKTCNSLFVNMKQAEMHFLQKHRQTTHGHSKQSLAQTRYSPVTSRVYDASIHEEEIDQIETQSRANTIVAKS